MPTVALTMIVKNDGPHLQACLASVQGVVDQIVVGDTGSQEDSAGVVRQAGGQLVLVPWQDNFAQARNALLPHVSCDWILVLDADERLDPLAARPGPQSLRAHLEEAVAGFQVTIRNYVHSPQERLWDKAAELNDGRLPEADPYPAYLTHQNVRLFRKTPELYFTGRVHESVGPRIVATGQPLSEARFVIHHFGMVAAQEEKARKNTWYRDLGRQKVTEQPEDAQAHFELGLVEFDNFRNDAEALLCFQQALRLKPGFGLAWFFAGAALQRLGHAKEALAFFQQAEACGYRNTLLEEMRGDCLYRLEQFAQAGQVYRRLLKQLREPAGIESKLGLSEVRGGDRENGLARMRRAIRREPLNRELYDRLIAAAVFCGDLAMASRITREKIEKTPTEGGDFLRLASILREQGASAEARAVLQEAERRFPDDAQLAQAVREQDTAR